MTDSDRLLAWLRETLDAAQADAEAATAATGGPHWHGSDSGLYSNDAANQPGPFLADAYGYTDPRLVAHITRHDPAAVLRRITADRRMLDDLLAEKHHVVDDPAYTCPAATPERDGGHNYQQGPCDCGRDGRVKRRLRLIAEAWGWTEETS